MGWNWGFAYRLSFAWFTFFSGDCQKQTPTPSVSRIFILNIRRQSLASRFMLFHMRLDMLNIDWTLQASGSWFPGGCCTRSCTAFIALWSVSLPLCPFLAATAFGVDFGSSLPWLAGRVVFDCFAGTCATLGFGLTGVLFSYTYINTGWKIICETVSLTIACSWFYELVSERMELVSLLSRDLAVSSVGSHSSDWWPSHLSYVGLRSQLQTLLHQFVCESNPSCTLYGSSLSDKYILCSCLAFICDTIAWIFFKSFSPIPETWIIFVTVHQSCGVLWISGCLKLRNRVRIPNTIGI